MIPYMEREHTLALDGSPTHGAVKGEVRFLARTRSTVRLRYEYAGHDGKVRIRGTWKFDRLPYGTSDLMNQVPMYVCHQVAINLSVSAPGHTPVGACWSLWVKYGRIWVRLPA